MNCCDDNGKCTGGLGCAVRAAPAAVAAFPGRSCNSLAICQGHKPPCPGCEWPATARDMAALERVNSAALGAGEMRFGAQASGAPIRLAPGVVEGYRVPVFGSAAQRRELSRWLWAALAWGSVFALAGLAAGVVAGLLGGQS
jgi:hypothetical protein